jgi:ABC-2 type transport system ATP-binding protein
MDVRVNSSPAAPAIEVQDLVKRYGAVTAVAGVSFRVARGETTALLGGNGAGKTTTIGMLLGLVKPTSGTALVLGVDVQRDRQKVLSRINFQSPYVDLPKRLTVRENLAVYARLYGVSDVARRLAEIAEDLSLGDLLGRRAGDLSSGQKTRVGLAKALLNRPEVLFLDEPTASLDPDTADWVRSFFERYRREAKAAILLASHNMGEVERLADNVLMMSAGRIVDEGAPAALLAKYGRETLEDVFLDVVRGANWRDEMNRAAE